jgi:hypothetical protein
MSDNTSNMLVRLPSDVKQWLVAESEFHLAPQNSVIVRALRSVMQTEQQTQQARQKRA